MEEREKVYKELDNLKIKYNKVKHPAIFSEKDEENFDLKFDSEIFKNLFLKNKNSKKYYLYCLPLKKRANLKLLANLLDEKKLCFANEEELYEKLRIKPGSVSIFNIIAVENTDVTFIIDEEIKEYDLVGFHPNDNSYTVEINYKDIEKILKKYNVDYEYFKV